VLSRFYGLGREFTITGITHFVQKLLVDEEVKKYCGTWFFRYTQPDLFVRLLYDIGFLGIKRNGQVHFRSIGSQSPTPPALGVDVSVIVHPTYVEALGLLDVEISNLDSISLRETGFVGDLPESVDIAHYQQRLKVLREDLKTLPLGQAHSAEFEELMGELVRLCFFRALTNVEPKVRSVDERVVRDWIAGNHVGGGFWEMLRQRYSATQIVFECKNNLELQASDFHQVEYYMTEPIGRFAFVAFRGDEKKKHYYEHIKRIANEKKGVVLLLASRDLDIFIRQAINGKSSDDHLRDLYDTTVREIS
jgi:hypothetical protein